MFKRIATAVAGLALVAVLGACSAQDWEDGYAGPAYVTGTGTCVNPQTGMPEYCAELSNGYSQIVPFGIYSTVAYGSVVSYSHASWRVSRSSYYRAGRAPDLYSVRVRIQPRSSTWSGSYLTHGQVGYRSPTGRAYSSTRTTRVSWSGRH